jgi:hypothetical protein
MNDIRKSKENKMERAAQQSNVLQDVTYEDVLTITQSLQEKFGDLPLSTVGRCVAIQGADQQIRAAVSEAITSICVRIRPQPKKQIPMHVLLRRAADKGDVEAKFILDNVSDRTLSSLPPFIPVSPLVHTPPTAIEPRFADDVHFNDQDGASFQNEPLGDC